MRDVPASDLEPGMIAARRGIDGTYRDHEPIEAVSAQIDFGVPIVVIDLPSGRHHLTNPDELWEVIGHVDDDT